MTEEESRNAGSGSSTPRFQLLTKEMVEGFDFEEILNGTASADCREYQDMFSNAQALAEENGNDNAATAYSALGALCGFHFRPDDVNDPYGPMVQMDGKRSPIPADFRPVADVIAYMAETTTDGTLKARLCDVAWLLNRRRVDLGLAAISAYRQIVRDVAAGTRKFRFEGSNSPYSSQSRGLLKRALSLAMMKSVGRGKQEEADIRQLVEQLFRASLTGTTLRDVHRIAKLALQYDVVSPLELGSSIEAWTQKNAAFDDHDRIDLLRLASSAYHEGGSMQDHFRSRLEIVDTQVRMARQMEENSATLAAGMLSDAISELHGIPDVKERRRELRHRLIDLQTNIPEEMGSISQEIDLKEIIDQREGSFQDLNLRDMLFAFAAMSHSPAPEELRKQAIKSMEDHPLSSIFGRSFHDRDGKVSYRAAGADLMSAPTDDSLRPSIAQSERIRREIFAAGDIQTARRLINESYYITDDTFSALLRYSPFVPEQIIRTYSRGFRRFFQGDPVSGVYILTPLLEASIRHILKEKGHDVSTFDNASKTQQDLTISAMFDQMKGELLDVFGDAIVMDIENVFLSQPGPTIRHEIAHGLMSDEQPYGPDAAYACWLIFRLCLIPLFPHREEIDQTLWQT